MRRTASTLAGFVDPIAAIRKGRGTAQFSGSANGHSSLNIRMVLQEELERAGLGERVPERDVRKDRCGEDGRGVGGGAAPENLRSIAVVRPLHRRADANVDPGGKEGVFGEVSNAYNSE